MIADKTQRCALRLLSLAPQLMQTLRVEMRAGRPTDLTVPQFRALVFFRIHPGDALSHAAEHLGLGLPAASKIVESLVVRGLLAREASTEDRRRVVITLTDQGAQILDTARSAAMAVFSSKLAGLSEVELDVLFSVLGLLQQVIGTDSAKTEPTQADSAKPGAAGGHTWPAQD